MVYNRGSGAPNRRGAGSRPNNYDKPGAVGDVPDTGDSLIVRAQGLQQGPRADLPPQPLKTPAPYMGRRQKRQMNTMLGQLMGDYATDLANGRDLLGTTTLLGS